MNKGTQIKTSVVKKYHRLMNKKAGYANSVCVGFLPLRLIFSLGFERKLIIGCGTAPHIAVPNRQGVALPVNYEWRADKRSEYVSHSYLGGSSKGATLFMFISPLGEKKITN